MSTHVNNGCPRRALVVFCACGAVLCFFALGASLGRSVPSSGVPCCNKAGFGLPRCVLDHLQVTFLVDSVGNPDLRAGGRRDAVLDMDMRLANYQPEFAVIVSLHNHANIVTETIGSLLRQVKGLWEIVFVFDECRDASLTVVQGVLKQWMASKQFRDTHCNTSVLTRVRFIVQPTAVWETSSDNLGLRVTFPSRYYLLVQADMTNFEDAFNLKLAAPFEVYPDLIAVSARCSHNLIPRQNSKGSAGRCGTDVASPLIDQDLDKENILFVRETVNRGPLLLHADRLRTIGLFDELNFFLGDDDHNMALRAFTQYGWKSGHFQVNFSSPLQYGSSRQSNKSVLSESQTKFLQGRKDQANLAQHHQMLELVANSSHWNEDKPVAKSEVHSTLKQSQQRLQFLHMCETHY